jgi:hypothetical protein
LCSALADGGQFIDLFFRPDKKETEGYKLLVDIKACSGYRKLRDHMRAKHKDVSQENVPPLLKKVNTDHGGTAKRANGKYDTMVYKRAKKQKT